MEHSHLEYPDSGYDRHEEWADMYLNFVLHGNPNYPQNGFTSDIPDPYKIYTRNSWMMERVPSMLEILGVK